MPTYAVEILKGLNLVDAFLHMILTEIPLTDIPGFTHQTGRPGFADRQKFDGAKPAADPLCDLNSVTDLLKSGFNYGHGCAMILLRPYLLPLPV